MKLAKALRERARLAKDLARFSQRLEQHARYVVTEGESPDYSDEEFQGLMVQAQEKRSALTQLRAAISRANAQEVDGQSVNTLLVERSELVDEKGFYEALPSGTTHSVRNRYSSAETNEIEGYRLTAKEVDEKVDELVGRIADLDTRINEMNARVEVKI